MKPAFPRLIFPEPPLRLRRQEQRTEIYDEFRRRWLNLSPEEWVRQHVLHHLRQGAGYPANRIAVEFALKLQTLQKRADIVVFGPGNKAWMIVECKAASVKLTQDVFDQAARYNLVLDVPFLVITNGLELIAASVHPQQMAFLEALPKYPTSPPILPAEPDEHPAGNADH